jgi:tRNA threonylcarbamoyladenosine modification (KEOPS) complex Cgi121 subunit
MRSDVTIFGATGRGSEVLPRLPLPDTCVCDAMAVACPEHLLSAALHALRALRRGKAISRTFSTEVMLYLVGTRQIKVAMERAGVKEGTKTFGIATLLPVEDVLSTLPVTRNDSVLLWSDEKGKRVGVGQCEEALELVASLELRR